jgi:hypothetical protein
MISIITATEAYKLPLGPSNTVFPGRIRHDASTGPKGVFFNSANAHPPPVAGQNLFLFALIRT